MVNHSFRADIEGLRALAILAVVGAHAGLPLLQGGFAGVDMFFVLSGYLISELLIREISASGKVNLPLFYARRFKRLLPGLLAMLLVTAIMGALVLAPFEQEAQVSGLTAASLWLSNFYFAYANFGYFDASANSSLYLHTWSLGVEEQFYLVWPLLVLYFMRSAATSVITAGTALINGFVLVFVASFLLCLGLTLVSPLWGFYSMPARGWQFALGGLVFLCVNKRELPHEHQEPGAADTAVTSRMQTLAAWSGLLLVTASTVLLHEDMPYPGGWALLPSAGAALLLYAGSGTLLPAPSRLLASPPLRALGRISYSWYLWHWPVLVLGAVLMPAADLGQRLALVLLSLLLATAAYLFVEQPLRSSVALLRRPALTVAASLLLMSAGLAGGQFWREEAALESATAAQQIYQQIRADLPAPYAMGCDDWFSSAQVRACSFGESSAENIAVLFGDSVGTQWFSALARYYLDKGWRFIVLTKSSCPIVDEPFFYERIGAEYLVCENWRNAARGFLQELKPQHIFIGSAATYAFTEEQWREGTRRILADIATTTERIYLIRGTPRLPFDGPGCLARQVSQAHVLSSLSACKSAAPTMPDTVVLTALQAAAQDYSSVRVLDFNPLVCPDAECRAHNGEMIVFRDAQHVANSFVEAAGSAIAEAIQAAD